MFCYIASKIAGCSYRSYRGRRWHWPKASRRLWSGCWDPQWGVGPGHYSGNARGMSNKLHCWRLCWACSAKAKKKKGFTIHIILAFQAQRNSYTTPSLYSLAFPYPHALSSFPSLLNHNLSTVTFYESILFSPLDNLSPHTTLSIATSPFAARFPLGLSLMNKPSWTRRYFW